MAELTANHPTPTDTGIEAVTGDAGPEESGGAPIHVEPNPGLEKAAVRDDMLEAAAAARAEFEAAEAAKAEGKAPPKKAAAPAPGKPAASPTPDVGGVEGAVERALAAREAKNEEQLAARREADRIRSEAQAEKERILSEARTEAEAWKARLRKDPVAVIKEAGWEPAALVKNLAEDGTPTSLAERQLLAMQQELAEMRRERQEERAAASEAQRAAAAAAETAKHETVGKQFVEFAGTEARPTLQALFKKPTIARALVLEASNEAERIQRAEGKPPAWDRLADWLESQYGESVAPQAAPPKATPTTPGKSNTRALSQQAASTNSVAPKTWDRMTPQEQKAAQLADMAAVRARFAAGEPVGDD
jgi:hypothetical protein